MQALGYGEIVCCRVSDALQTLRETPCLFDLILNDVDQHAYPESLPVIYEKLRPGGVLIVKNMLWHEQTFNQYDKTKAK